MDRWYLVKTELPRSGRTPAANYHIPEICCTIGRILGHVLMFAGGYVIGSAIRGLINALIIIAGTV